MYRHLPWAGKNSKTRRKNLVVKHVTTRRFAHGIPLGSQKLTHCPTSPWHRCRSSHHALFGEDAVGVFNLTKYTCCNSADAMGHILHKKNECVSATMKLWQTNNGTMRSWSDVTGALGKCRDHLGMCSIALLGNASA